LDQIYQLSIEKSILSSILFNPEELPLISNILSPLDFYSLGNQQIFETMIALENEDMPIDEEFIRKRVDPDKVTDTMLIDIIATNPITNVEAYAIELKELSKIRQIQNVSTIIPKLIANNMKSDDIIYNVQKELDKIQNNSMLTVQTTDQLLKEILNDMQKAAENNNNLAGCKSGLKELDKIVGAFEDGDLIVIAARPSMGKTSIISSITIQSLIDNNAVLIESLEMPSKKIMSRLLAAKSGENLFDMKKGLVKNKDNFNKTLDFFNTENLIIHDKAYPTLTELQSRIKITLRKNPNIKNVLVDHTGKIQLLGKTREDIEIGHISAMLKKIARDYNIRVFLLQQLNRGVESRDNKRPLLSDIKNSGNIEEDADIVLGLYRDSYYKNKKKSLYDTTVEDAEIIVLKNRDGRTATAKVGFEPACARFVNKKDEMPIIVEFE